MITKQRFLYTVSPYIDVLFGIEPYHLRENEKNHEEGDVNKSSVFKLNGDVPQGLNP